MNERVWLHSSANFVNMVRAFSIAFIATFLTYGCSKTEDSPKQGENPSENASPIIENELPQLPIIWESRPADGPIVDLAIAKAQSGDVYITAILEDGSAQTFDLDGIPVASSEPSLFSGIHSGTPLTISETNLLAHAAVDIHSQLTLAIISPQDNGIALAPLAQTFPVEDKCTPTQLPADNSIPITFKTEGAYLISAIELNAETPLLSIATGTSGDILDELCPAADAYLPSTEEIETALQLSILSDRTIKAKPSNSDNAVTFTLRNGMSVTAPAALSGLASYPGFVSQDYQNGIIVAAGQHDDGTHKLSFISAENVWQSLPDQ